MPTAIFNFGENLKHECRIELSNFGVEKYYVDGNLVHKSFSLSPKGTRVIKYGEYSLAINVSIGLRNIETSASVNGEVVCSDLFPEITKTLESVRNKRLAARENSKGSVVGRIIIWLAIVVILQILIKKYG